VDQSGVIAVIFAVSLLAVPMTVAAFFPHSPWASKIAALEQRGSWAYEAFMPVSLSFSATSTTRCSSTRWIWRTI